MSHSGYKNVSSMKYWNHIKRHNSTTLQFVSLVADYILQVSTAHLEFSKSLRGLTSSFQEKFEQRILNGDSTSSKNGVNGDNCFRFLWEELVNETLKDAQLNSDLSFQLQQEVVQRLRNIQEFKEVQSKMLVEFRGQMEMMLDASLREVQTQQKLYNESIRELTRSSDKLWSTLATTGDVLKSSSSPFLSAYTSSSSSSTYNCTRHNECVLVVKGAQAKDSQYKETVLPSVLEDLEEIYIDVVNTLLGSLEGCAILFSSKARQESRHYDTFSDIFLKKVPDPKQQLSSFIELLISNNPKEPSSNPANSSQVAANVQLASLTSGTSEQPLSPTSMATRKYSFHVPSSILDMVTCDSAHFKQQLVIDGYSLAELDAKKSNLKKSANELVQSLTQSEETLKALITRCQECLSSGNYLESYEIQNELCGRRLVVHKDIVTLATIASQLDLLTQKQNFTTGIPTPVHNSGGKLTIKGMWKQAFKNLRIGENSAKKQTTKAKAAHESGKNQASLQAHGTKQSQAAASSHQHALDAREYQLLEKYSKLFLPQPNRYRSEQTLENSSSIYAIIEKVSKTTRVKTSCHAALEPETTDHLEPPRQGTLPQKVRSFKAAARMVIKKDGPARIGDKGDPRQSDPRAQQAADHSQISHSTYQSPPPRLPQPPKQLHRYPGPENGAPVHLKSHARHQSNIHRQRSPQSAKPPQQIDIQSMNQVHYEKKNQLSKFRQAQQNADRRRSCFASQKSLSCDYPSPSKAKFHLEEVVASAGKPELEDKRAVAACRRKFADNRPASRSLEWTDGNVEPWSPTEPTVYGGPIKASLIPFMLPRLGPHVSDSNTESESEQTSQMKDKVNQLNSIKTNNIIIHQSVYPVDNYSPAPPAKETTMEKLESDKTKRKPRHKRTVLWEQKSCSFDVVQEASEICRRRNASDPTVLGLNRRSKDARLINYKESRNIWVSSESGGHTYGFHSVPRPKINLPENIVEVAFEDSMGTRINLESDELPTAAIGSLKRIDASSMNKFKEGPFDCLQNPYRKPVSDRRSKFIAQKSQSIDQAGLKLMPDKVINLRARGGQTGRLRDYMNEKEIQEILMDEPKLFSKVSKYVSKELDRIAPGQNRNATPDVNQLCTGHSPPKSIAGQRRRGYAGQKSFSCDVPLANSPDDPYLDLHPVDGYGLSPRCLKMEELQIDMKTPVPKQEIHKLVKLEVAKTDRHRVRRSDEKARVVSDGVVKWKRRQSVSPDKVDSRCYYDQKTQKFYIDEDKLDEKPIHSYKQQQQPHGTHSDVWENTKKNYEIRPSGDNLGLPSQMTEQIESAGDDPSSAGQCYRTNSKKKMMHLHSMKTIQDEDPLESSRSPRKQPESCIHDKLESKPSGEEKLPRSQPNPQEKPASSPRIFVENQPPPAIIGDLPILIFESTSTLSDTPQRNVEEPPQTSLGRNRSSSPDCLRRSPDLTTDDLEVSRTLEKLGELSAIHTELSESKSSPPCFNSGNTDQQDKNKKLGSNLNVTGVPQAFSSVNISSMKHAIQIPLPKPRAQLSPPSIVGKNCVAFYSYKTSNTCDLSLEAGQIIEVLDCADATWWKGRVREKIGYFPASHVSSIRSGEKVMKLVSSVNIFDEKMSQVGPVKLFKNQIVIQENCTKSGLALIRTNDLPNKMFCPAKYLVEVLQI